MKRNDFSISQSHKLTEKHKESCPGFDIGASSHFFTMMALTACVLLYHKSIIWIHYLSLDVFFPNFLYLYCRKTVEKYSVHSTWVHKVVVSCHAFFLQINLIVKFVNVWLMNPYYLVVHAISIESPLLIQFNLKMIRSKWERGGWSWQLP